jgi:hypothetical protein
MENRYSDRLKRKGYRFPVFFAIVLTLLITSGCEHFSVDSEDNNPNGEVASFSFDKEIGKWSENGTCCTWSATLSDLVKRSGTKSIRFELRQGDVVDKIPHAELGMAPSKSKEGWFAFSVYFPAEFERDTIEESIVQWQSLPDFSAGETWRSPPLVLGVLNDSLVLEIRSDSKKITSQGKYSFERVNLGPLDKETWLDWVFHVRWAYDNTGIIEVWKNDKMVLSRINAPNSFNDDMYPYLKIGLYKWGWLENLKTKINSRAIYIDDVTVGNEKSGYDKVYPGHL